MRLLRAYPKTGLALIGASFVARAFQIKIGMSVLWIQHAFASSLAFITALWIAFYNNLTEFSAELPAGMISIYLFTALLCVFVSARRAYKTGAISEEAWASICQRIMTTTAILIVGISSLGLIIHFVSSLAQKVAESLPA